MNTQSIFCKSTAFALAVVVVGVLTSLPGVATEPRQLRVRTSDLNVKTPEGAKELYRRLQAGSAQLCGTTSSQNLEMYAAWKKCYTRTLQDAVNSINEPALIAIHKQQHGAEPAPIG